MSGKIQKSLFPLDLSNLVEVPEKRVRDYNVHNVTKEGSVDPVAEKKHLLVKRRHCLLVMASCHVVEGLEEESYCV